MRRSSFLSVFVVTVVATLVAWGMQALRPQSVLAIPMFAKRTGASCELCHTVFPGMSNYGMMVMMSDFSMLPYHGGGNPGFTSLVYEEQYLSNPDGNPAPPKLHTENLGILNGGFIGPHFTYYLEQHVVDGGFVGGTDQLWVSYNELFGGTGALQFGKFHTPFPFMPAHRITIAPYATTSSTIGANGFTEDDSHWGVTLSQMQGTLMYSVSALGGNDLVGPHAFQLFGNHDHSIDVTLMSMSDQPLNYGFGAVEGFAPPASAGAGFDRFTRSAVYLQYIPRADQRLQLQAVGQLGFDSDPFGTGMASHTRGGFVEAQFHFVPNNWGILRWDTQNGDTPVAGVTFDFIRQLAPNWKVTLEGRKLTTGTRFGVTTEWAGPWSRHSILAQPVLGEMPGMKMEGMQMGGMQMSGMQMTASAGPQSALDGLLSAGNAGKGQSEFQALNCAACHGTGGSGGGVGPRLVGLAEKLQPQQIYDMIKHPHAPMPDFKLADADIADLVAYVVSLTPGHNVAGDIAKLRGASATSGMNMGNMSMPGMSMPGMSTQSTSLSMAAPPPYFAPEEAPMIADERGYYAGVEQGDPQNGGRLYAQSCQACHAANGGGVSAAPLNTLGEKFTPSHIAWHIRMHPATTAALRLTNKNIADLVAFVETLDLKGQK